MSAASPRFLLEIACDDAEDAVRATEAGADRIELCAALEVGGVTPGSGLLQETRAAVRSELVVLARPRRGDFVYDARTLRALERDVEVARELGADGVAVGALTAEGAVDTRALERLVRAAGPLSVTFHRAFDSVRAPEAALATLAALGVTRVLTSGGAARALDGAERLAALVASAPTLEIVAAGGVRAEHAAALVARARVRALHASASRLVTGAGPAATSLAPSRLPAEDELRRVDPEEVARLRAALPPAP